MRKVKLTVDSLLRTRFCPRTKPLLGMPAPPTLPYDSEDLCLRGGGGEVGNGTGQVRGTPESTVSTKPVQEFILQGREGQLASRWGEAPSPDSRQSRCSLL